MKINKSQLAKELEVDRRTIQKYLDGFTRRGSRNKGSKIDEYYEIIAALLMIVTKSQSVLRRFLKLLAESPMRS